MADYDLSKPAPDRTHRIPLDSGTGLGGLGFMLGGVVLVGAVLWSVFGTPQGHDAPYGAVPTAGAVLPAD